VAVVLGILKVIAAVITMGIGLISLVRPRVGAAFADIEVPNARAVAEIRLVFGGLYVGLGLAPLILADPLAFRVVGLAWLGELVARAIAAFVDRPPLDSKYLIAGLLELVLIVILLV
jgi:hypothetical protein